MATTADTATSTEAGGGASDDSTAQETTTDLSVLQSRDAYIDANLTTILHTTPKQHTYLDTTPNTERTMTDTQLVDRQRQRIDTLEKENAAWVEQYNLATQQNQSLQAYADHLQQQLDRQPSTQPAGQTHNSLYRALLSENAALLSRLDSLQRRCRVQEGMIETRNTAIREMQRICAQQQQRHASRRKAQQAEAHCVMTDKQQVVHEEEKRREDDPDTAVGAPLYHSILHSRESSTASTQSERSVELEQAEALIDAVLMRPPRIFVPASSSPSVASTTPSSPKEERKQLDDSNSTSSTHSSSPRVVPSKPSTLARRIGKPPLTVQSKVQRPAVSTVSSRLSPRSTASPSPPADAYTRTRSSSATATAGSMSKVVSRVAGGVVGKSANLSPALSSVPSSPRSPPTLPSNTASRPPRSPIPRSPLTTKDSAGSKPTTKLPKTSSTSSASAHSSASTTTRSPTTRSRPVSTTATVTDASAELIASTKPLSVTKATAQSTTGRMSSK